VDRLKFKEMPGRLRESVEGVPEHRTGQNTQYGMADAGLGAFAVFYVQSGSFLAYQRDTERNKGQNNVQDLYGAEQIPNDGQIRNLLDRVEPRQLREPFWQIYDRLEAPSSPLDNPYHLEYNSTNVLHQETPV